MHRLDTKRANTTLIVSCCSKGHPPPRNKPTHTFGTQTSTTTHLHDPSPFVANNVLAIVPTPTPTTHSLVVWKNSFRHNSLPAVPTLCQLIGVTSQLCDCSNLDIFLKCLALDTTSSLLPFKPLTHLIYLTSPSLWIH